VELDARRQTSDLRRASSDSMGGDGEAAPGLCPTGQPRAAAPARAETLAFWRAGLKAEVRGLTPVF